MSAVTDKRVLHLISGLGIGGAERCLCQLVDILAGGPYEFEVVSLSHDMHLAGDLERSGVRVTNCDVSRHPLDAWLALRRVVARFDPEVLHGWMYHGSLAASLVGRGRSVVWSIRHSLSEFDAERWSTRQVIRLLGSSLWRPDVVLFNSHGGLASHAFLKSPHYQCEVIANGVDVNVFRPDPAARHRLRTELGIANTVPVIGCVARNHPMKDVRNLLRALKFVKGRLPDVRLVLVGKDMEESTLELRELLDEFELAHCVHLLGPQDHVEQFYPAIDMLALSSRYGEGMPNVLLEAMACGVPCVTTAVGDAGLIIGEDRAVVAPNDARALADACLARLTERSEALSASVRSRVATEFSLRDSIERYAERYQNLGPTT